MTSSFDLDKEMSSRFGSDDSPGTVLTVDDNDDNLKLLEAVLTSKGYTVVKATNGAEALALLGVVQPDVIFLDVMMPGMDGFEVTRRIRSMTQLTYIPIVLLTALQETKARLTGLEAGANDFLSKPFSAPELLARAHTLIRLHRQNLVLGQLAQENRYLNDLLVQENNRMALELDRAREAQLRLMPQAGPNYPQVGFAVHYKPALEVGGDYYDYIRLDEEHFAIVLGDAVGKGGAAVLAVAIIKSVLATEFARVNQGQEQPDPAELLAHVNRIICGPLASSQTEMTLWCGIVNLSSRVIHFSNAGQTFPYLAREGELIEMKLSGLPIGLFDNAIYSSLEVSFQPGDRLILYSDGINEASNINNEQYGLPRLETAIRHHVALSPELLLHKLINELSQFCADASDDQTLVVFGF